MKSREFDGLTPDALRARIEELKSEYFGMRMAVLAGKEKNSAALKHVRRRIAQASGFLRSSEIVAKKVA